MTRRPLPVVVDGVHLDPGQPPARRSSVLERFGVLPSDNVGAFDMVLRTSMPGLFWLVCSLYLAISPPDARGRYICALASLRRMEPIE